MPDQYDIAQICLNGHLQTHNYNTRPEDRKKHCVKCGEVTTIECAHCKKLIKGGGINFEWINENEDSYLSRFPFYCEHCGKAYPWTERKLQAIEELTNEIKLSKHEKELLLTSLSDLIVETPKTSLALARWKKFLTSSGKEFFSIFEHLATGLLSEAIRKALFGA